MSAWLRLTWLFGLPDHEQPENLMAAALGPILRASLSRLADASLPPRIQELLEQLAMQERAAMPLADLDAVDQHVLAAQMLRKTALGEPVPTQLP